MAAGAFGASMGLGILATTQLLQSSWLPTSQAFNLYSIIYFYSGLGSCAALLVWATYFAMPEPERSMVLSSYHVIVLLLEQRSPKRSAIRRASSRSAALRPSPWRPVNSQR